MKEVTRIVSIKQLFTTPYNPKCNGLCEKMNGTLKSMLGKMCQERPKDWDRYLPAVLFAYREAPHASTGFSPFELLFELYIPPDNSEPTGEADGVDVATSVVL